jgi:hypothetical protein
MKIRDCRKSERFHPVGEPSMSDPIHRSTHEWG